MHCNYERGLVNQAIGGAAQVLPLLERIPKLGVIAANSLLWQPTDYE